MAFVIAEIGVNHNGSVSEASHLISAAADAGADAVKFQAFDPERLEPAGERRDMLAGLRFDMTDLSELAAHADAEAVRFIVTPFHAELVEWASGFGKLKISSGSIRDKGILDAAAKIDCDILLSTGMATHEDIWCALRTMGWRDNVTLLQCTSSYPCPPDDVNLRAMEAMRLEFGCPVGLSDHTLSTAIPAAAVAMGAKVIEKHLTRRRDQEGPDHKASLEPNEFRLMVQNIRDVERAMGDGIKRPQPSEAPVMAIRDEREAWRCQV